MSESPKKGQSGMTCNSPGAVTTEDFIAYADGEAPARVLEHLRTCPTCAAQAAQYQQAQRRLRRTLYRFECPTSQTLGEYELGLLPAEERQAIAAHVLECPLCADELRILRHFLVEDATAEELRRPGVVAELKRIVATLVAAPAQPSYALRGSGDAELRTYRAGDVTIAIGPGPAARRGRASLTGLIWREDGEPSSFSGTEVRLIARDETQFATQIDESDNFTFEDLRPGTYRLELLLAGQTIVIQEVPTRS